VGRPQQYSRDQALDCAVQLFWVQGYHATSMRDIEHALDMRPGSIYAAFGSKENLLLQALTSYAQDGERALLAAAASAKTPLAALRCYLRDLGSLCAERPAGSRACMVAKALLEFRHDPTSEVMAYANAVLDRMEVLFRTILDQARELGEIPATTDTARLARLMQTFVLGLRNFAERDVDAAAIAAVADDLAFCIDACVEASSARV